MDLVLLKLKEGYQFGDVLLGGRIPSVHEEMIVIKVFIRRQKSVVYYPEFSLLDCLNRDDFICDPNEDIKVSNGTYLGYSRDL